MPQTTLGLLLFQNGNQVGGMRWLKAAAEQGEPRALLVYGTALFNGDGVTQDPVLGYAYVSRAAAQGLAPAKATLAQLDQLMPLDDRKKGVALAMAKAKAAPPPAPKTGKRASPPKPRASAPRQPKRAARRSAPSQAAPRQPSGDWRIQLGAFSQARRRPKRCSRKLVGQRRACRAPALLCRRRARSPGFRSGRSQASAAAAAACSALEGQACFPVAAK